MRKRAAEKKRTAKKKIQLRAVTIDPAPEPSAPPEYVLLSSQNGQLRSENNYTFPDDSVAMKRLSRSRRHFARHGVETSIVIIAPKNRCFCCLGVNRLRIKRGNEGPSKIVVQVNIELLNRNIFLNN